MVLYDWLLFFHVAGVFAVVAGQVVTTGLILAAPPHRPGTPPLMQRLSRLIGVLFGGGGLAILVFGIWLVVHVEGYEFTDWWILGGLVLWLIAAVTGTQAGTRYGRLAAAPDQPEGEAEMGGGRSEAALAVLLHAVSVAAVVLALMLMIFKPGVDL